VPLLIVLVAGAGLGSYLLAPRTTQAPDFTLTSTGWENGNATEPVVFSLTDYRGQVVVLDFMAVMCTSCRAVTSEVLVPLHDELGTTILSIDTWADPKAGNLGGETTESLVALQQREGVPWRHALDTDRVWEKYSAVILPKLVVVDADGRIAYTATGLMDYDAVRSAVLKAEDGQGRAAVPQAGLLALASAAGLASFFAPCAIGLLPAYLGVLLPHRDANPLAAGLKVAAGMSATYAVVAVALMLAAAAGAASSLQRILPSLELAMGLLLVALALLLLFGYDWGRLARAVGLGRVDGRRGLAAFGVAYALAGFACTGPILFPILVAGLAQGPWGVAAVFAAYASCLALFLVAVSALVAGGKRRATEWLLRNAPLVNRASAVLILAGGLYLIGFYWSALR
jgi:cytochrome c-type biogenesis protein